MGRNKDSLIALAEKLTGETCGGVLTKKDALKKIACFYAGQEVECNTVADALQCIAEHCSGGASGGASGGKVILYYHSIPEMSSRYYLTQDPVKNIGKEQTLLSIDGGGNITEDIVTVTDAGEGYTVITRASGNSVTLYRSSSGDITFDCGGSGESGSVKLQKVYAWFYYHYQSTIYTFTRNPKVDDMAFSISQSKADDKVSFVKIIGVNTDDSGNVQSIDTNFLSGYGYYGEAMLFDGYPIVEENGYPQGFVNADNGTMQVNLTVSKADRDPSVTDWVKWQVNGIDSNLHAYASMTEILSLGRKVFIVNNGNVAIGDFASLNDLEGLRVINTDNPYYVFYGNTDTLPRTVQLISATVTNEQDMIVVIDGTCVINLTITE